jgi:hypothetical protein
MYIEIYVTTILPGVLYGCKTWVSDFEYGREEGRLKVLESRVLRKIF